MNVQRDYDVVVLGAGAAGLTAALAAHDQGASVGVFEKAETVGGATAMSGGVVWIPNNRYGKAAGVDDSREAALAYLASLSHGKILPELAEALVDGGPPMLDWLDAATPLKLRLLAGYPDYHPEHPGGQPGGGRSLEPALFSFDRLNGWAERVGGGDKPIAISESPLGGGSGFLDPDELQARRRKRLQGAGRALVGGLLLGCLERGVEPVTGARATRLLRNEDGRICGVAFEGRDGGFEARARRGVVLATGGFEWAPDLVRDFLRGPLAQPPSFAGNTGDGLRMAMQLGAQLGNMQEAWWAPVAIPPGEAPAPMLVLRERTLPRSILVNGRGRRFANEAANYNALGAAFHQFDAGRFDYANVPAWLICDATFVQLYGGFGAPPGSFPDWAVKADTLEGLADRIGVPGPELAATVARWNAHASELRDPDFGRGESRYDGWSGDQRFHPAPQATLGPIDTAPFYAVQIHPTALGTKGGPRTDAAARILDTEGAPIPGLYGAGNVIAGPTGMVYGGAGGTLGPAMVFGWIAGRTAAASNTLA